MDKPQLGRSCTSTVTGFDACHHAPLRSELCREFGFGIVAPVNLCNFRLFTIEGSDVLSPTLRPAFPRESPYPKSRGRAARPG